ncbi:hypothetical protein ACFXAZ_18115 [Streptomyces sp. NPDC059477]|uniref:hypothetical protein n=1 Tax=Streptomyces sp. NPDC059477 TaxID=3346847 RepID=UPI0036BC480F
MTEWRVPDGGVPAGSAQAAPGRTAAAAWATRHWSSGPPPTGRTTGAGAWLNRRAAAFVDCCGERG